MKQKISQFILLLCILLGLISCINEIEFTEEQTAAKVTINCLAKPDSIIKVSLSLSKFFLSSVSGYEVAKDYQVNLSVNDVFKETLKYKSSQYVSIYKPKVGDKLYIVAKKTTINQETSSNTVIPFRTSIISIDTTMKFVSSGYLTHDTLDVLGKTVVDTLTLLNKYILGIKVNFKDSLNFANYYRLTAQIKQYYSNGSSITKKLILIPDDIAFDRTTDAKFFDDNPNKLYNIFNDNVFDGKQYGLKTNITINQLVSTPEKHHSTIIYNTKIPIKTEIVFDLQSISEDFFLYLKTVKYNDTDLRYFSEPIQIYNNIQGGIGIFGSITDSYYKITLPNSSNTYYSN